MFSLCTVTTTAQAAVLYQTVRTDCEYGANLSAVRNARLGEIVDVRLTREAVLGRNLVQRIMTAPLELWTMTFVTREGATRDAGVVVNDQAEAESLAESVRTARVVEWIGPCYVSFKVDGAEVHASEDPMVISNRWQRFTR